MLVDSLKKQVKLLIYSGNNVTCPCCGHSFKRFFPFNNRPKAECPFCLSLERHRLLYLFFKSNPAFSDSSKKLLHIAPEKCLQPFLRAAFGANYTAGDKFTEGYSGYAKDTINLDVTALKFPDNSFDILICNHVLEHVPEDRKAMSEVRRVLKPGGFAILQVPIDVGRPTTFEDPNITDPKEREKHFGQYDHVRVYGDDYKDRLEQIGFCVDLNQFVKSFSDKEIEQYGLPRGEDLYLCYK
jgi:SAM-dependent methyltransferase